MRGGEVEGYLSLGEHAGGGGEDGMVGEVSGRDLNELVGSVVHAPDDGRGGSEGASRELTGVEGGSIVGGEGVGLGGNGEDTNGGDIVDVDVLAEASETVVGLEVVEFVGVAVVDE